MAYHQFLRWNILYFVYKSLGRWSSHSRLWLVSLEALPRIVFNAEADTNLF